jgi:outer membrane protein assembly factor BamB
VWHVRSVRWHLLLGIASAIAVSMAVAPLAAASLGMGRGSVQGSPEGHPWPMVGGDASHSGTSEGPEPPYRVAWSASGLAPVAGPIVADGAVILVEAQRVVAVEPATGQRLWDADRDEGPGGPAAVAGDLVIFAEGRGSEASISAVRLEDGESAWTTSTRAPALGGPAVDSGNVLVGTADGRVLSLAADEGTERWMYRATGRVDTSPAVEGGAVYVAAEDLSSGAATVYALDAGTGREEWRFSPSGPAIGVSSVSVRDRTAVVGMGDFMIHGFDASTGADRWRTRARAAFTPRLVPAAGDPIVLGDGAGHMYGVAAGSGKVEWTFRFPDDLFDASPIVAGDSAVVGDGGGQVSAIDLRTGLLVWKRTVGRAPVGAIASDGERLYVAVQGRGGRLVALEHDPGGQLLAEHSPTELFLGRALLNFVVAAGVLGAALVLGFRSLANRPAVPGDESGTDDETGGPS